MRERPVRLALGLALSIAAASAVSPAAEPTEEPSTGREAPKASRIRSEEDGWIDLSGFLDTAYGFIPIVIPITEPAIGYGGAGAALFIDRPSHDTRAGFGRPNMSAVGGLATENGTRGLFAGDVRQWAGDRLQTLAGIVDAEINLDFYGRGKDPSLEHDPLRYTLEPLGGLVRGKYRIAGSRLWAGLSYMLADTRITFDDQASAGAALDPPERSRVGGLTPSLTYDSRDNIFTPTRGTYGEGSIGVYDEALGGDSAFERLGLTCIVYLPIHAKVTLGIRGDAAFAFGDTPFYMLPFLTLRGAPVLRYQGEDTAEVETEVRWQFWKRLSAVGFVGGGSTWNDFEERDDTRSIITGGAGIRYELARKYGLHAGLDVAWGPDDSAIYIQFGSAWARP